MSLEQKIELLTAAVEKLTAKLSGAQVTETAPAAAAPAKAPAKAKAAAAPAKTETTTAAPVAGAVTIQQIAEPLKALSMKDHAAAQAIIQSFGVERASLVPPAKFPELLRKIELALNPGLEEQEAANPSPDSLI